MGRERTGMRFRQLFVEGLCEGLRPGRRALPMILVGAVTMALLLLAGTGLFISSELMHEPLDLMTRIVGEALMVAGGLVGLAASLWAWWLMFQAAGFLGNRQ